MKQCTIYRLIDGFVAPWQCFRVANHVVESGVYISQVVKGVRTGDGNAWCGFQIVPHFVVVVCGLGFRR
jgi:hypothetical protein